MQAVIMAAGEGKRMRPLTLERPKPLIEVSGKTILEHVLDALPDSITEIILIVGYKADMVRAHIGDSYQGLPVRYAHQWMPAGTAHALSVARPLITGKFLLLNADDIQGKEALTEAVSHELAILVAPHDRPESMGVVSVRENGTLEEVIEKPEHPKGNLVSTGGMVLDERLFSFEAARHESGEYFMTHPLNLMAKELPITVVEQSQWIPIGRPEDIATAEAKLGR